MAKVTTFEWDYLSDLIGDEFRPSLGRSRRDLNLTIDADTQIPLGLLVFKAKDLDQSLPYAPVTDPTSQIVEGNTFAIIFGDGIMERLEFQSDDSGTTKALGIVQGEIILKDRLVLKVNGIDRDSTEHKALKTLLEREQNIYLEKTLDRFFE